jgi:hypothetical protein
MENPFLSPDPGERKGKFADAAKVKKMYPNPFFRLF